MIFKGTIDKVLNGTKTQTRRPVRVNHGCVSFPNSTEIEKVVKSRWHPCLIHRKIWTVGQDYAVQPGRGKSSIARIRIKSIRKEKLMDISLTDCIAEGIETTPGEAEGAGELRLQLMVTETGDLSTIRLAF